MGATTKLRTAFWNVRRLAGRLIRAIPEPKNPMEVELGRSWIQSQSVRTVIDVGANEGQFAATARRLFPSSRILSFEPIEACYEKLPRKPRRRPTLREAFQYALGDQAAVATFHQNKFSPSSSLLAMKEAHKQAFPFTAEEDLVQVPVRRLDDVVGSRALEEPILLKLDVQGSWARVLGGRARHLLRAVVSHPRGGLARDTLRGRAPRARRMIWRCFAASGIPGGGRARSAYDGPRMSVRCRWT